jgi:hypothetical protein
LIGSVFGGLGSLLGGISSLVGGSVDRGPNEDALKEEREARQREQEREEAEERRRERDKVLEARELESKRRAESLLSRGAAALADSPEVSGKALKTKLGE